MKRLKLSLVAVLAALLLGFSAGCVTNEAGRKQLMLVSGEQEMQMGLAAFNQMKKEVPISKDPAANALVQRVGKRIASVVNLENAQWEFVVFESKEANAFCLPGGKIGVYTGILPVTKDEDGLATVIGHEVAHATLHHGGERVSREIVRQGVGELGGAAAAGFGTDPRVVAISQTVYGAGVQLVEALPHSRAQESEADHLGLLYMARAGYNPRAAVDFWTRFSEYTKQSGGSAGLWFLRTHPVDSKRIQQLEAWMPEAETEYRQRTSR